MQIIISLIPRTVIIKCEGEKCLSIMATLASGSNGVQIHFYDDLFVKQHPENPPNLS